MISLQYFFRGGRHWVSTTLGNEVLASAFLPNPVLLEHLPVRVFTRCSVSVSLYGRGFDFPPCSTDYLCREPGMQALRRQHAAIEQPSVVDVVYFSYVTSISLSKPFPLPDRLCTAS